MILKKKILISCFLLFFFSCTDDFLDKVPPGVPAENYFYNEKGIDALLTGCYAMVRGSALYTLTWGASIQNWTFGSAASDDAYLESEGTNSIPVGDIERWDVHPTNPYPADKWRWAFGMGVDRANKTLKVIEKSEKTGSLSVEQAEIFRAEAKFLRALFNFEAWLVFGDRIPLITETTTDPSKVSNLNSSGKVLEFIVSDLKYAWEKLPEKQTEPGRTSKFAAMGLAARAYLQELKYSEAKPLLDAIILGGKYQLMPNFFDNFRIARENNAESLFEIQANVNDIRESLNAEMGIGLNWPHGGDIGMCCGFHQASQNLANAFRVDANGLPVFDSFNNTDLKNDMNIRSEDEFIPAEEQLDPRIDWTISRRGIPFLDWGINRGKDWVRSQRDGGPYLPAIKPFFYKSQRYTLSTTTGWMTGVNANNYRYLRYSHILLWRAEVAAFEGDLEKARELVNQIRDRADNELVMGKVLIYKLPKSVYPWGPGSSDQDYRSGGAVDWTKPAANYKIGLYPAFKDKNEAMRAAQWEQRLEFATEGRRFFDLRRWDKLPAGMRVNMAETLNNFALADQRIRKFMQGADFDEKDKFQPIPQLQLDAQPGVLVQNPGY